ncbi:MAG: TRAP transporter small permease [Desulfobacteraceae bacterium]|nr:TRAP transporter small permease [Desulfobacteraceae bacterium]MDH3835624.1 TRAP transporter small permease [Desulfobacteraceae bacterium]MDH3872955.1 TRAP transporter small permease [Desulfobacteraceae bacterium]
MDALERISRSVNHWVEYVLFGLGFAMSVVVAVQVFFRYALNDSLFWSEELARYLLVWLTFLGASVAYRRNIHPGVDIVYTRMPASIQRAISIFIHFISTVLFGVMIFYGIQFSYFVRLQISPALYLPKWIVFSIIPLSGIIFMIHGVTFLVGEIKGTDRDH